MADQFIDIKLLRQQTSQAIDAHHAKADAIRKDMRASINTLLIEAAAKGIDFILVEATCIDDVLRKDFEQAGYALGKNMSGQIRIGW